MIRPRRHYTVKGGEPRWSSRFRAIIRPRAIAIAIPVIAIAIFSVLSNRPIAQEHPTQASDPAVESAASVFSEQSEVTEITPTVTEEAPPPIAEASPEPEEGNTQTLGANDATTTARAAEIWRPTCNMVLSTSARSTYERELAAETRLHTANLNEINNLLNRTFGFLTGNSASEKRKIENVRHETTLQRIEESYAAALKEAGCVT